jgi:hypothetical protein
MTVTMTATFAPFGQTFIDVPPGSSGQHCLNLMATAKSILERRS